MPTTLLSLTLRKCYIFIRLIEDPALTDTLDPLAHYRTVYALPLFYKYHRGFRSDEIKSINLQKFHLREIHDFLRFDSPTR